MGISARLAASAAVVVFLHGCGGGGGSGGDSGPPPAYSVGGAVSGLAGSGLVLSLNGGADLPVGTNGSFTFSGTVTSGSAYAVTVKTQPASPSQTCAVTSGSGTMGGSAITNVSVACTTLGYTVGGTVSGLSGTGLTLQLNGADELAINASGNFTLPGYLTSGAAYSVSVKTQPTSPYQTCVATNNAGTISTSSIGNVAVACTTNSYAIGGTSTNLLGTGLVLQLNGARDLAVDSSGTFSFPGGIDSGTNYTVTVKTQPAGPSQTCTVTNPSGVITNNATTVGVNCTTNAYVVGGTPSGLLGTGLKVKLNGGPDLAVAPGSSFAFPAPVTSGDPYAVTVSAQPTNPSQTCITTGTASGIVGGDAVNVAITCTSDKFTVGGTVAGLTGSGLVLQLNGAQDLPISGDGNFVFPTGVASGTEYNVTVQSQTGTFREVCRNTFSSGTIGAAAITNVRIDCSVVDGFIYAGSAKTHQIHLYGYSNQTGKILALGPVASLGTNAVSIVSSPSGSNLYVADLGAQTVRTYAVNGSKGSLTPVGSPITVANPIQVLIDPSGKFLYVPSFVAGSITRFSIDAGTGEATSPTVVANVAANGTQAFLRLAMTPDGAFIYVVNSSPSVALTVTAYAVNQTTGALTAGPSITPTIDSDATIDSLGRFLYLRLFTGDAQTPSSVIYPYSIDTATGALTPVGVNTTLSTIAVDEMLVEPTGRFTYLLSRFNRFWNDNNVSAASIDQATGAVSVIQSPKVTPNPPGGMITDPAGKFLFVGTESTYDPNGTWYDGSTFAITQSGPTAGQLTPVGASQGLLTGPLVLIQ